MKIAHTGIYQNTPEWRQFRAQHYGASEAAAMLGLSKTSTRNQLLHEKYTGMKADPSFFTQKIFDNGHAVEALARPFAEQILGESLFPETFSDDMLSASCDGITADHVIAWENKQWNAELADLAMLGIVPDTHMPQCQQILMVTGAEVLMFTVTDGTKENFVDCKVFPDPAWFDRIRDGWAQFHLDLAAFIPKEKVIEAVPETIKALPVLFVHARGEITDNNMDTWGELIAADIAFAKTVVLTTNQDAAFLKETAKKYRAAYKDINDAKARLLAETISIGDAFAKMDTWTLKLKACALSFEKNVDAFESNQKLSLINAAKRAYSELVDTLNVELGGVATLPVLNPDFAGSMKNKRSYEAWESAVDTTLANAKIEIGRISAEYRQKVEIVRNTAPQYHAIFYDLFVTITKPLDDFRRLVDTRIDTQRKADEERLEQERKRIQAEEEAKAREKMAAERAGQERKRLEDAQASEQQKAKNQANAVEQPSEPQGMSSLYRRAVQRLADPVVEQPSGLDSIKVPTAVAAQSAENIKKPEDSEMMSISKGIYQEMRERLFWLQCLEEAGVDNWDGIYEASRLFRNRKHQKVAE